MKAINDNGTIKTFTSVPKSWNGKIGLQYASDSDLEALGFYDVEQPTIKASQEYGEIEWDSDNSRFTYQVNNKTYTQTVAQLKEQKIANLKAIYNRKLSQTDWYVVRAAEGGTAVPSDIATERSDLRTQCATKESEINAKTTKAQVIDYQLPNLN
jgi:1,2-phenylacetyl-CoA epoxidase PaaB subunit